MAPRWPPGPSLVDFLWILDNFWSIFGRFLGDFGMIFAQFFIDFPFILVANPSIHHPINSPSPGTVAGGPQGNWIFFFV